VTLEGRRGGADSGRERERRVDSVVDHGDDADRLTPDGMIGRDEEEGCAGVFAG
jgi:hypothetical protein